MTPNKHRFNDLYVARLAPRAKQFLVWDIKQHGLALLIQPSGHRAFKCIYSIRGRSRWYHLGDAAAIDVAAARKLALNVMVQVADGKDPAADRSAFRHATSFEDLVTRYLKHAKTVNKSWRQADKLIRRHVLPRWSKLQAADISRSDVKQMLAKISAPVVANQTLAATSAVFSWAVREEAAGVKANPCVGVSKNKVSSRERVLAESEISKFWVAFDDAGLIHSRALRMILLTGQRPGEIAHMRTEHIQDGWWTLPGDPVPDLRWSGTKNSQTHRVWLPRPAQDILTELEPDGFVFPNVRGNGPVNSLDLAMRAICEKLQAERATPHDLRRSHGSTVTALGFGRDAMNRIQNHREGGISDVYDRFKYATETKHIMETVAARIVSLVDGRGPDNVLTFERVRE